MPTIAPEAREPAREIHVAVGVIVSLAGEVLVTQRAAGTHLAGFWEFPGGKVEPAEPVQAALKRELDEELGIQVTQCRPLLEVRHRYSDKAVRLDVWQVSSFDGEPHGREGQPLSWVSLGNLAYEHFPAADRPIIDYLRGHLLA